MNIDVPRLYLSIAGRIGRRDFWVGAVGLVVAIVVVAAILGLLLGVLWGNFVTALIDAFPVYALLAKRLQDRDHPGAYAAIPVGLSIGSSLLGVLGLTGTPAAPNMFGLVLGAIAGVVGAWVLVVCGLLRGTIGNNRYGPDRSKGRPPLDGLPAPRFRPD